MSERSDLILVADDDPDIRELVMVSLVSDEFDVATAADGREAWLQTLELMPDVILLDVVMPEMDGLELARRLARDPRTRHIPLVAITAGWFPLEQVPELTSYLDDYITKPFDLSDLSTRVRLALRRARVVRSTNPLTQLPGNVQIEQELIQRISAGAPLGVLHIDLDNFKAFNDRYGFLRGDEAIKLLAKAAGEAVGRHAGAAGFLGHVGGDDLIGIVGADDAESTARTIVDAWDRLVEYLYDPNDAERGYVEIADRQGDMRRFPLMTVSIGIATNRERPLASHWEASEVAGEMKQVAKRDAGSSFAIDRRKQAQPVEQTVISI